MRKLIDTPNAGGITAAYPDGSIVDQTGETLGTALTDILYGDLIQMMHKLKRLAAITENNLPDNESNGFQLLDALFANTVPQWTPPSYKVDYSKTRFVSHNNGIYYHKTALNTTNPPTYDTTNWAVVFYWNGSQIIFSDEARIAAIEALNATQTGRLDGMDTYNVIQDGRLSGSETDITLLGQQKADKTNVIEKNNTTEYLPVSPYNPATVRFVTESIAAVQSSLLPTSSVAFDFAQCEGIVYFSHNINLRLILVRVDLLIKQFTNDIVNLNLISYPANIPKPTLYIPLNVFANNKSRGLRIGVNAASNYISLNSFVGSGEVDGQFSGTVTYFY